MNAITRWFRDLAVVLGDRASSLLILPAAVVLAIIDWARFLTLVEWMAFAALFVGFSVHLSRLAFPQIDLTAAIKKAGESPLCNTMLACTIVSFMGVIVIALAIWTKP